MWGLYRQVAILQEALEKLSQWCYKNSLSFHPAKYKVPPHTSSPENKLLLLWARCYFGSWLLDGCQIQNFFQV